jgi:hypothetical protein
LCGGFIFKKTIKCNYQKEFGFNCCELWKTNLRKFVRNHVFIFDRKILSRGLTNNIEINLMSTQKPDRLNKNKFKSFKIPDEKINEIKEKLISSQDEESGNIILV